MIEKLLEKLEKEGKIKRQAAGFVQIEALLRQAMLDLQRLRES